VNGYKNKMYKIIEYAPTAHNRTVYASGAVAPSGYEKPQSAYGICAVFLRNIFGVAVNLRFPATAKRHIQPERYAKWGAKFFCKFMGKGLTKYSQQSSLVSRKMK
jgi:hypothetical protein